MNWKVIKAEKEYKLALSRLEEIFDSRRGDKYFDEAELLVLLIEKYENETQPKFRDPDPIEVIKFRMESQELKSKDLANILGSRSKASEILNRKRKLSLEMIRKINIDLKIPAEFLIADYELENR